MEITSELLEAIQDRATEVAKIKYGTYPDKVVLDGGTIKVIYESYCCGSTDTETEYVYIEEMNGDIEEVVKAAKIAKEKKQKEEELRRLRIQQQEKERREEQDKNTYLKLKARFDGK